MNHRKIAKLAGVSPSTVSKALSGSGEISEKTANKIRKIAIDTGYFKEKSRRKREYANGEDFLIAVIVPEIMGFHYATIVTCIKNHVEAKGGHVAVYIQDFDPAKSTQILQSIILRGATDGVILFSKPELTMKPNIPMVYCGKDGGSELDSIGFDGEALVEDAVRFLTRQGHRRIGFVGEPHTYMAAQSFEKAMKKQGLDARKAYMYSVEARFEQIGHVAALQILEQKERPTAILAAYDEVAIGLVSTLMQHGIRVPEDISVMGINNIPSAAHAQIPLTTVETFSEEQYAMAVDVLYDRIRDENRPVRHIVIEHRIIERETTRAIEEAPHEADRA